MVLEKTEKIRKQRVSRDNSVMGMERRERVTNEGKPRGNTKRMVGV